MVGIRVKYLEKPSKVKTKTKRALSGVSFIKIMLKDLIHCRSMLDLVYFYFCLNAKRVRTCSRLNILSK